MVKLLLSLLILISVNSCVYFNTFYNAKKYYKKAREMQIERLQNASDSADKIIKSEEDEYAKSIEKCSKILKVYPHHKKYVALSTLLLGEIYFFECKYPHAIRKFNEFLSHHPNHKKYYRAIYFKAMCFYEEKDYNRAEVEFGKIIEKSNIGSLITKSQFMLAEISILRGSSFGAIDHLKKLKGGGKILKSLISFKMGNLLFSQKEYDKAYEHYLKVEPIISSKDYSEVNIPENIKFKSEIMAGRCLLESGDIEKATKFYYNLLENNFYEEFFAEVYSYIALSYKRLKKYEDAKDIYLKIIEEFKNKNEKASAYYELGELHEKIFGNLLEAFDYYRKAYTECSGCEKSVLAKKRYNALRSIMFLTSDLDSMLQADTALSKSDSTLIDSIKNIPEYKKMYEVAEIYFFELNAPDSAFKIYSSVFNLEIADDSSGLGKSYKMRSLYSMAWINKESPDTNSVSDSLFRMVIKLYPATRHAKASQKALGEEITIMTHKDSVIAEFLKAESLYTHLNDCKSAINLFQKFADKYKEERYTARALLAVPWLYENCLYDNKSAESKYRELVELYPNKRQGRFAKKKLDGLSNEMDDIYVDRPGEGAEGSVLDSNMAKKMSTLSDSAAKEKQLENMWVQLVSIEAVSGEMKGELRSKDVIMEEVRPALETIDEIYIDMVDEDLMEEGLLGFRVWIRKTGEVNKIKSDVVQDGVKDKLLIEEIETVLFGMEFYEDAKKNITIKLKLKFINRNNSDLEEREDIDEEW